MIVVDTSAAIAALASRPVDERLVRRLRDDGDLHAPHLIDVEVIHVLRRLVAKGELTIERAEDVRSDFADLAITRYPQHPLADRMWDLEPSLTAYDASFVALSEAVGAPLVTCDARLAAAGGHQASIELFEPR